MTTEEERKLWITVYSAVLQGLCSNPEVRLDWPDIRERADTEANIACREVRKI